MIRGKNINLRAIETSDLAILKKWRNIPEFRKNFREHKDLSLFNQQVWYEKTICNPNDFMFIIEDKKSFEPLGACGLLYTNWIIRSSDFSFYIGYDNLYIDDNIAMDAAETLLRYGFNDLNLNKIWMELYEFDVAKIEFFTKKLNFNIEGKLRQNAYADGKYWDSFIISMLKSDYVPIK